MDQTAAQKTKKQLDREQEIINNVLSAFKPGSLPDATVALRAYNALNDYIRDYYTDKGLPIPQSLSNFLDKILNYGTKPTPITNEDLEAILGDARASGFPIKAPEAKKAPPSKAHPMKKEEKEGAPLVPKPVDALTLAEKVAKFDINNSNFTLEAEQLKAILKKGGEDAKKVLDYFEEKTYVSLKHFKSFEEKRDALIAYLTVAQLESAEELFYKALKKNDFATAKVYLKSFERLHGAVVNALLYFVNGWNDYRASALGALDRLNPKAKEAEYLRLANESARRLESKLTDLKFFLENKEDERKRKKEAPEEAKRVGKLKKFLEGDPNLPYTYFVTYAWNEKVKYIIKRIRGDMSVFGEEFKKELASQLGVKPDQIDSLLSELESTIIFLEYFSNKLSQIEKNASSAKTPEEIARIKSDLNQLQEELKRKKSELKYTAPLFGRFFEARLTGWHAGFAGLKLDHETSESIYFSGMEKALTTLSEMKKPFSEAVLSLKFTVVRQNGSISEISGDAVLSDFNRLDPFTQVAVLEFFKSRYHITAAVPSKKDWQRALSAEKGIIAHFLGGLLAIPPSHAPLLIEKCGEKILALQPREKLDEKHANIEIIFQAIGSYSSWFVQAADYKLLEAYYNSLPAKITDLYQNVFTLKERIKADPKRMAILLPSERDEFVQVLHTTAGYVVFRFPRTFLEGVSQTQPSVQAVIQLEGARPIAGGPQNVALTYREAYDKFFLPNMELIVSPPSPYITLPFLLANLNALAPDFIPRQGGFEFIEAVGRLTSNWQKTGLDKRSDFTAGMFLEGSGFGPYARAEYTRTGHEMKAISDSEKGTTNLYVVDQTGHTLTAHYENAHGGAKINFDATYEKGETKTLWTTEGEESSNKSIENDLIASNLRVVAPPGSDTAIVFKRELIKGTKDYLYTAELYQRVGDDWVLTSYYPLDKETGQALYGRFHFEKTGTRHAFEVESAALFLGKKPEELGKPGEKKFEGAGFTHEIVPWGYAVLADLLKERGALVLARADSTYLGSVNIFYDCKKNGFTGEIYRAEYDKSEVKGFLSYAEDGFKGAAVGKLLLQNSFIGGGGGFIGMEKYGGHFYWSSLNLQNFILASIISQQAEKAGTTEKGERTLDARLATRLFFNKLGLGAAAVFGYFERPSEDEGTTSLPGGAIEIELDRFGALHEIRISFVAGKTEKGELYLGGVSVQPLTWLEIEALGGPGTAVGGTYLRFPHPFSILGWNPEFLEGSFGGGQLSVGGFTGGYGALASEIGGVKVLIAGTVYLGGMIGFGWELGLLLEKKFGDWFVGGGVVNINQLLNAGIIGDPIIRPGRYEQTSGELTFGKVTLSRRWEAGLGITIYSSPYLKQKDFRARFKLLDFYGKEVEGTLTYSLIEVPKENIEGGNFSIFLQLKIPF
ncbi:MAG: hypothetical protein QXG98_03815 [Candidatus Micrarchaeia archaeon]